MVGLLGIVASLAFEVAIVRDALSTDRVSAINMGLAMAVGLLPAILALEFMTKVQSRAIVPRLAAMVGLNFPAKITRQITSNLRDRVRPDLLPDSHRLKVNSFAVGHLGEQELIWSEIRIPDRSDDDFDIFKGVLLILRHHLLMPEFQLVARDLNDKQRKNSAIFGTTYQHVVQAQSWPDYRLYVRQAANTQNPLLPSIIDLHFRLANQFDASARLLCSICDGRQTQIAIQCNHSIGQIGGLSLTRERLEAQVRTIMQDFSTIYASAGLLREAENLIAAHSGDQPCIA